MTQDKDLAENFYPLLPQSVLTLKFHGKSVYQNSPPLPETRTDTKINRRQGLHQMIKENSLYIDFSQQTMSLSLDELNKKKI